MSDTRALLDRITTFRRRLERTPDLLPGADPDAGARTAVALAGSPDLLSRSLRTLTGPDVADGPVPARLTVRARRLLEDAQELIAVQRGLTADPVVAGLARAALEAPGAAPDPLVTYTRETVALTDAALRMVQAFPASADAQVRMCDGVDGMLRAVRDRLTVAGAAVAGRRRDVDRVDGLARRLVDIAGGRAVDLGWFMALADQLVEDGRQAAPLRFPAVDPLSSSGYPGGPVLPCPARFVAAHSVAVAQVVARVVTQDYEWAGRPLVPVVAALIMDVGMLRVPAAVLATPGPLTTADRRLIDGHPTTGADMVRAVFPDAGPVADAIAAHHERPDGTGYPHSLAGDSVPPLARLLAACDTYAGMCEERPHRPAADPRAALTDVLLAADHGRLDRDFTEYLLALTFHPVGTVVELTDGRVGAVVATHPGRADLRAAARPVVAVLTDPAGAVLPRPAVVDLAAADRGAIVRSVPRADRARLLARSYPELCG